MRSVAIKQFEITEGSDERMWYVIRVFSNWKQIDMFHEPTMQAARDKFAAAGYKLVEETHDR